MDFDFITDEAQREKAKALYEESIAKIKSDHQIELDEQVSGLKAKNSELLGEKKKVQEDLKKYSDFDMDKAKEALEFLENNKDAQMVKDGKIEELFDRRVSVMRSDHEAMVTELKSSLKEATERATNFEGLYKTKTVQDTLRDQAIAAKVRPEAIPDVVMRGSTVFSVAENDPTLIEARDHEGKLCKTEDDKVLTPANWINGLKKVSPHYWPESKSAGAYGGTGNPEDKMQALQEAADRGDHAAFRKLREEG